MTPPVDIIVAAGADRAIGLRGDMPFHISADLRRFKALTMGLPLVMGRKTFESLPGGALPGRRNIVVTRQSDYHPAGAVTAPGLAEALALAAEGEPRRIMVIGGGDIYRQALPLAGRIYLTEVGATFPEADTFFPPLRPEEWAAEAESDTFTDPRSGLSYRFIDLVRRKIRCRLAISTI